MRPQKLSTIIKITRWNYWIFYFFPNNDKMKKYPIQIFQVSEMHSYFFINNPLDSRIN